MVNALFQVWNSVGIVRCHTEDEISSIEVEFHDTSTHHPLHLTNHLNHTMAALSSTALLLACEAQEDSPRYFYHRLVYLCVWEAQWPWLTVCVLDSRSNSPRLSLGWDTALCSWVRHLTPTVSLSVHWCLNGYWQIAW